ncbi:hypothetical protein BJX99DRAFT_231544 [Aspergillus californicus]
MRNMDVLLSKKTGPKRRASLSLLFGSQKPTFAALNDKPTQYYDFVDTPAVSKPSSAVIRQDISIDLESQIRWACAMLAYKIQQGVPSLPNTTAKRTIRTGPISTEDIASKTRIKLQSKYSSPEVRPNKAPQTGYDSGVGLTQQPSMQTMRILHSRSGASDSDDITTTAPSIFSNSGTRTGTSCSDASAHNSHALSCDQSSVQSPKQGAMQEVTGMNVPPHAHQNLDTRAFLSGPELPASDPNMATTPNPSDIEGFINPVTTTTTNLSCETLQSSPSPSLGLSRVQAASSNRPQHQDSNLDRNTDNPPRHQSASKSSMTGLFTSNINRKPNTNNKSIIIDIDGCAHLLTPDQESQRNKALQQAVIEKMRPGFVKSKAPSQRGAKQPDAQTRPRTAINNDNNNNANTDDGNINHRQVNDASSRFRFRVPFWSPFWTSSLDTTGSREEEARTMSMSTLTSTSNILGRRAEGVRNRVSEVGSGLRTLFSRGRDSSKS